MSSLESSGAEPQPTPTGIATQSAHPWRATVRTVLVAVISAAVILPSLLPVVSSWATEQDWLPEEVTAAVVSVTAIVVAVAGLLTRLWALPGVEAWFRRHVPWLAAAPHAE